MQQHWIGHRIKGFNQVRRYGSPSAQSAQLLGKHGLAAAMDTFGVSRRTLYGWEKAYRDSQGNSAALNNASRAPKRPRQPAA